MKISEILFKAADLIEPEGAWCQGPFAIDENGEEIFSSEHWSAAKSLCAAGALTVAAGGYTARRSAARLHIERVIGDHLVDFNEAEGRTQAEVVAKLREAATKAQEQGQ